MKVRYDTISFKNTDNQEPSPVNIHQCLFYLPDNQIYLPAFALIQESNLFSLAEQLWLHFLYITDGGRSWIYLTHRKE